MFFLRALGGLGLGAWGFRASGLVFKAPGLEASPDEIP